MPPCSRRTISSRPPESQARNKYTYFASKAKKEGFEQIAAFFQETADNEKERKLVKYYPQFKDAPAAYKDFKQATESAMAIDPDKRSTYQSEFSRIKAPEMSDQSTLVSAWAEQNFEDTAGRCGKGRFGI